MKRSECADSSLRTSIVEFTQNPGLLLREQKEKRTPVEHPAAAASLALHQLDVDGEVVDRLRQAAQRHHHRVRLPGEQRLRRRRHRDGQLREGRDDGDCG